MAASRTERGRDGNRSAPGLEGRSAALARSSGRTRAKEELTWNCRRRLVITYCESRKRASVKMVVGFLEKNFPLLRGRIQIKPYPSPLYAKALKAFAIGSSVVVIFLLIFGETIFKSWYLGVPRWFRTLQHDQVRAFLLILLIGWFGNRMLQTKAFEIDLDGERIFSGMTSGKRVNTWEIAALLEQLKEPRVITTLDADQIRS